MHARILVLTAFVLLVGASSCADEALESGIFGDQCPAECPSGFEAVEYCPVATSCEEYSDCDDLLICAPIEDANNDNHSTNNDTECGHPFYCPPGSVNVTSCPDGELCTRITICETSVLCQESTSACLEEPLCPEGDRALADCDDDEYCYENYHCRGPVNCLRCDENLATECPEDMVAVDAEECSDEDGEMNCERVETCAETLYCTAPPTCVEYPVCPEESYQVEGCEEGDDNCFVVEGCETEIFCRDDD